MNLKSLYLSICFFLIGITSYSQNIIYISSLSNGGHKLYALDLEDCSYTHVVDIEFPVFDITFHPNGELYGLHKDGNLYEISTTTGECTLMHVFNNSDQTFNSMTADINGLIYVTGGGGQFYSYNISSDQEIFYGTIPYSPSGDFTFYRGDLYVAAEGSGTSDLIIKVDIQNPSNSSTFINENLTGEIYGIVSEAFDCSDVGSYAMSINGDGTTSILQIDYENASLDFLCNINVEVGGGASTLEYLSSTSIAVDESILNFPSGCFDTDGSIEVIASGGVGELEYSFNGGVFQSNNIFTGLSEGLYEMVVRDENNCIIEVELDLRFPILAIESISIDPADCEGETAQRSFSINLTDNSILVDVTINDSISQSNLDFQNYEPGIYNITIANQVGCEIDTTVTINQKFCALYIPNAFSPNADGYNDVFKIYPHPLFDGEILSFYVFDRWGNTVYDNKEYSFEEDGWDGFFNGKKMNPSVFIYMVEVDYGDGLSKTLSGDVTLVE